MPDRWGRIGYDDFMGIARGLSTLQAMGQRKTEFEQKQQFDKDYESNLSALGNQQTVNVEAQGPYTQSNPTQIERPVEMVGSQRSQIAAKQDYATGLQSDLNITDAKQDAEINSLSEKITAWKSANPGVSFDQIPIEFTAGVAGQKAKANVIGLYGESAEAQKKFMENRMPIIKQHAMNFFNNRKLVNDALGAGNTDMAVNGLVQMSKELTATPYQLGKYDPESKSFELKYFDRRTGKLQKNGTKSLDEVVQEMNAIGEKEFISYTAANMEAKRKENLVEEANPKHGKTSGGTPTLVTAQVNPLKQDDSVAITVRNEKTGETIGNYPSWDAFYDAGNSKEDLAREESKAKTGAANALAEQRNAARDYDIKRTNALGVKGKKYTERIFYDKQGNSYTSKSPEMEKEFRGNNWTIKNPKMNKEMYENSVKAFSIQFGFEKDINTETVSGVIKEDNWQSVLKAANDQGFDLMDEHGHVVDSNGIWPGGKEQAIKVSVMPMGERKSSGDAAALKDKYGELGGDAPKGKTDGVVDPTNSHVSNGSSSVKPSTTDPRINDMGGKSDIKSKKADTKKLPPKAQEIKDIYRFGAFDEPEANPLVGIQKWASQSIPDDQEKFGEGPIGKALRDTGIESDMQKQKYIIKAMKSKYRGKDDAYIIDVIRKSVGLDGIAVPTPIKTPKAPYKKSPSALGNSSIPSMRSFKRIPGEIIKSEAKAPAVKINNDEAPIKAPKLAAGVIPEKTRNKALKGKGMLSQKGTDHGYGLREDNTYKGRGYFGELKLPGGKGVATEVSMSMDLFDDGNEILLPALVPTLSSEEVDSVLNHMAGKGEIMQSVYQKAGQWAMDRLAKGKSPFAEDGEQKQLSMATAALGRK